MEQINPYAVMRNTATNKAYRAYLRDSYKAGQPLLALCMVPALTTPFAVLLFHRPLTSLKWGLAWLVLSLSLAAFGIGFSFLMMAKYRRDHPIPDEWRQVPRVSPPRVSAQRPRRP